MRRWHSPLFSLTILGMLFWLGTAMAPSVRTSGATPVDVRVTDRGVERAAPAPGPLLPWPQTYCASGCPEPPPDPAHDSEDWRPEILITTTTLPRAVATRTLQPPPPAAPRPVEEWRSLVAAYFAPTDVDLALTVIACESGGDPNAQNPKSGAAGLFQHIPRYWEARSSAVGLPGASIFDPVANVAAAAYLVYADGGWKHWAASSACW